MCELWIHFSAGKLQRPFASFRMTGLIWGCNVSLLLDISVEHAFLLEVMGHSVLGQKWRLQPDFGADPFAFRVRSVRRMVAATSTAELGTEIRALNLIELADLTPGGIAYSSRDVDLQL